MANTQTAVQTAEETGGGPQEKCGRLDFRGPIAELAKHQGISVDEAVALRVEQNLAAATIPIEVSVRPIEPQGKLIGFASVNFGGVVVDDFKVVNGQNGIFWVRPQNPTPTSRTGYRATVRINDRATQERLNAAGWRLTIRRLRNLSPGRGGTPRAHPGSRWIRRERRPRRKCRPLPPRQRERRGGMADSPALGQNVPNLTPEPSGLYLMDGIAGLRSLPGALG